MVYWLGFVLLKIINKIYFHAEVYGREHVPQKNAYILAANHVSNLDPFILSLTSDQQLNFVAKEELFEKPFSSMLFHALGAFPIKRDSSDFKAIRETLRRLKNGTPIVMFPEGTRGVSQREKKKHPGIGFIALKSNVPVIPVYLVGTDKALPNGAKWFCHHKIKIYVGKPVVLTKDQPYETIVDAIMQSIYQLKPAV